MFLKARLQTINASAVNSLAIYQQLLKGNWLAKPYIHDGKGNIILGLPNYTSAWTSTFNLDGTYIYKAISAGSIVEGTYSMNRTPIEYRIYFSFLGCLQYFDIVYNQTYFKGNGCGGFAYWTYTKQ